MNYKQGKYRDLITLICVITGAAIAAVNLNTFVNAGGLFPGGFNGLTVLIDRKSTRLNSSHLIVTRRSRMPSSA